MPAEVQQQLARAASILSACDVKERQLSEAQATALARGAFAEKLFLMLAGFIGVPLFAMALMELCFLLLGYGRAGDSWMGLAMTLIGTAFPLAVLTLVAFVYIRRRRTRLFLSCAAVPPLAAGESASCRVCGSPVVPPASSSVARCAYCQADNVVSAQALARAASERAPVLDRYEESVVRHARVVGSTAAFAVVGWYVALPLSFVLCGLPIGVATSVVSTMVSVVRDVGAPRR